MHEMYSGQSVSLPAVAAPSSVHVHVDTPYAWTACGDGKSLGVPRDRGTPRLLDLERGYFEVGVPVQ
jgi:hypothetical protein